MRKIVFAAGGTGGHIIPAIAIADALCELDPTVEPLFIGTGKEIERRLYGEAGYRALHLPSLPLRGRGVGGILKLVLSLPPVFLHAVRLLRAEKVCGVIGFGGYPSFLPVLASWVLRIPRLVHEQNVQVGLANKALSLIANKVYAVNGARGFPRWLSVTEVPNPVRARFLTLPPFTPPFITPQARFRLLVLGGSQGAASVNDGILALAPLFKEHHVEVVHQTGERDLHRVVAAYQAAGFAPLRVVPFMKNVSQELGEAHLVISRAGAMSVAEITAAGRPAIYIPLHIAGAHQQWNCERQVALGAAQIVEQRGDFHDRLRESVLRLLTNPTTLSQMAESAVRAAQVSGESAAHAVAQGVLTVVQSGRRRHSSLSEGGAESSR